MANVCCSIETEPKTLNEGKLNRAREVAADVVQKMEPNEASNVFNEGLSPLVPVKEMEQIIEEGEQLHKLVGYEEKPHIIIESPCQCSCTTTNNTVDSPDQVRVGEPLSAPF